ncbi:MAG: MBL fold metallo-hydrolase [Bacteroidota bacterium]|jgi:phosphoribosyl 1,2-cyclic phosphate phosphodiesterase|nr:MBL fold metallo-hydrolase [Bacteroidota bacterium]
MTVSLRLLGTGTSQGVPAIGCDCDTCRSTDARDTRLRPSALFTVGAVSLLIDTSSDFRQQMLRHGITRIDAVLYTHHHFDHIGGFDDVRQFNYLQQSSMPCYGRAETLEEIRQTFRYAFSAGQQEGGGVPSAVLNPVVEGQPFRVAGVEITPIPVRHGMLPILGYRVGNVAYLTDTNGIPETSMSLLAGLDVLVLDALRHRAHPTHFSLTEAIDVARGIGARRTYFTHIAHTIMHARDSALLPDDMEFSYDGLSLVSEWDHHD